MILGRYTKFFQNKRNILLIILFVFSILYLLYVLFGELLFVKAPTPFSELPPDKQKEILEKNTTYIKDQMLVVTKSPVAINGVETLRKRIIEKKDLENSNVTNFTKDLESFGFETLQVSFDAETDKTSILYRYYTAKFSKEVDLDKVIEICNKHKNIIEKCEKNIAFDFFVKPNDPEISNANADWQYNQVKMYEAWDIITGNKNIKIGVIDQGIDKSHPDLANNIIESNSRTRFHGTAVSCMIGCEGNNGKGLSGAMQQVSIIGTESSVDENNPDRGVDGAKATNAMIAAVSKGIKVINMSFGGGGEAPAFSEAMRKANQAGIILVASAGNHGNKQGTDVAPMYPANSQYVQVISAATDSSGKRAGFSGVYANVKVRGIAAPGAGVLSASMSSSRDYSKLDGTSFSSPYSAGIIGLIWAANTTLSANDVIKILFTTADCPQGSSCPNNQVGWGINNAYKAVSCAKNLADKKVATIEECKTNNPTPTPAPSNQPVPAPSPTPTPSSTPSPTPTPTSPGTPRTPTPTPQPSPNPTPNPPSPSPTPTPPKEVPKREPSPFDPSQNWGWF